MLVIPECFAPIMSRIILIPAVQTRHLHLLMDTSKRCFMLLILRIKNYLYEKVVKKSAENRSENCYLVYRIISFIGFAF
jgi:hypothetical protein